MYKRQDKQHAIDVITTNNSWLDYIDYHISTSDVNTHNILLNLIHLKNKQRMKQFFVYYKQNKQNENNNYLKYYFKNWRMFIAQSRRNYVSKIEISPDNIQKLSLYIKNIKLE